MKTVLVTGSSRGIGKEIAVSYAKEGYNIVLNCIKNKEKLDETLEEIKKFNKNVLGIVADVSKYNQVKEMEAKIKEKFGSVDVLINNAGISYIGLFSEMNENDWLRVIESNLLSVINCSQVFSKAMIQKKEGSIINISSVWGLKGASCEAVYSASKGGVNAFTESLAREFSLSGIRINAIACGIIDTQMNSCFSKEEKEALLEEVPLNRFGTPKEVAELCLFLSSEKSSYITGEIIKLDGGFL